MYKSDEEIALIGGIGCDYLNKPEAVENQNNSEYL